MRKLLLLTTLFVLLGVLSPIITNATPPNPDCDPLDPNCPIDGGLSILVAAGIGLGAFKTIKNGNKNQ